MKVRYKAAATAEKAIAAQMQDFRNWAVMGDWEHPYKTMDKGYEAAQLEVFRSMFRQGLIYRDLRPVYWSPSSQTALAEAELEYSDDHISRSIYVRLPVKLPGQSFENVNALVWTTTPWTIPANMVRSWIILFLANFIKSI